MGPYNWYMYGPVWLAKYPPHPWPDGGTGPGPPLGAGRNGGWVLEGRILDPQLVYTPGGELVGASGPTGLIQGAELTP